MKKFTLDNGSTIEFSYSHILYDAIRAAYSLNENDDITDVMIAQFFKEVISKALDKELNGNLE